MSRVLVALALAGLASCHGDGAEWSRYRSSADGFSVEFPGKPTESVQQSVAAGTVTEVSVVKLERGARGILQVASYTLLPIAGEIDPVKLEQIDCQHPFEGSHFTAGAPTPRPIAGHPGLVVTGTAPRSESLAHGGWEEDRCVVAGGRMFHLTAIGPDQAAIRRDGARFLDSFALSPD